MASTHLFGLVSRNAASPHAATPSPPSASRFPVPDEFEPAPSGGASFSVAGRPQPLSPSRQRLMERMRTRPDMVLEDVVYAQWRAYKVHGEVVSDKALWRHVRGALTSPSAFLDFVWNRPFEVSRVAAALGVDGVAHLTECVSLGCNLNRLMFPNVRSTADAYLVDTIAALHGCDTALKLVFVGCGGLFAEMAFLQQLRDRGFARVEAAFIDWQLKPTIDLTRDLSVESEVLRGYNETYHDAKVEALKEVAAFLAAAFDSWHASFYANDADFIEEQQRQDASGCHAVIALDPGLDGLEIEAAQHSVAAIQVCAGTPRCLSAVLYSGMSGWIRNFFGFTEPPTAHIALTTRSVAPRPTLEAWKDSLDHEQNALDRYVGRNKWTMEVAPVQDAAGLPVL